MEIPSLDKQCTEKGCKQLDFLPLQCKCGKIFCSEHFNLHVQSCEKSLFLVEDELRKVETVVCSHAGCKEKIIIPFICERCNGQFCVKHRHFEVCEEIDLTAEKEKYAAPVRQFNEAKACVDKELDNKLAQARSRGKNETVRKIQLMRIKSKAVGLKSIPTPDRLYFSVVCPSKGHGLVTAVFVSKQWSLGRAIDAIALELKIQNNNNKANEKKLRLFNNDTKEIVSGNMSVGLTKLFEENVLINGEDLIIEYVDNECVKL